MEPNGNENPNYPHHRNECQCQCRCPCRCSANKKEDNNRGCGCGDVETEHDVCDDLRERVGKVISDLKRKENSNLIKKLRESWRSSSSLKVWTSCVSTEELDDVLTRLLSDQQQNDLGQLWDIIQTKISFKHGIFQMLQSSELGQMRDYVGASAATARGRFGTRFCNCGLL